MESVAEMSEVVVREALWKGEVIAYIPGLLTAALGRGIPTKAAYDFLVELGCKIDFPSCRSRRLRLEVPPKETLRLATILGTNPMFCFVDPVKVEKECFH